MLLATTATSDSDNVLLQKNFAGGALRQDPVDATAMISSLSQQVREMKDMMAAMQKSLDEKLSKCCNSCSPPPDGSNPSLRPPGAKAGALPGMCATFGDPHITTFDGAHTILLRDMPMWLVKSDHVWVQGLAKTTWGNLMGVAVGGPFMQNHSLVIYNSTLDPGPSRKGITVLFDGQPILLGDGDAEFESPFILWAARRNEWTPSIHDRAILEMDAAIDWNVGPWPERFTKAPEGGIYVFKFPWGVELTVTGVDFMSAVVRMFKAGDQAGYCGNFDGIADDEYQPPDEGSVPPMLVPAWGKPVGDALDPVPDDLNLFLRSRNPAQLVRMVVETPGPAPVQPGQVPQRCDEDLMVESQSACSPIHDLIMWQACVIDYCLQRNPRVVQDMENAEGLQETLTAKGTVVFMGHGQCVDDQGRKFRVRRTSGLRNFAECMRFTRESVNATGVLGAQLQVGGTCEIVLEATMDTTAVHFPDPPVGTWAEPADVSPEGAAGTTMVSGVEQDLAWSCWRLN